MKTAGGLALLKRLEGCRLKAYKDGGGVWTIGYGHTHNVKEGDTCTQAQADAWVQEESDAFESGVARFVKSATPSQLDAMTILSYNIGLHEFSLSTVCRLHNRGDYAGAAKAFALFNKDNGKVVQGLINRRAAEAALYQS